MIPVTVLHRQSRARAERLHDHDAARAHLEQCHSLPDIVTNWWGELDPTDLHAYELQMVVGAILAPPEDVAEYARKFRVRAYLDSAECETLIDDMAAGAKEWPR